ncbi:MAG TPA: MFS transporter [Xanthobacteraceae bacterium]
MSAPNYVVYFILLSSIGIIAAALAGLRVAVSRADWKQSQRVATLRTMTVLLPLWFAAAVVLSYAGAFRGTLNAAPTIEFGIFLPIIVGLVWLWRSATAKRLLDAVPQSWLVGLQFYRVIGAIFLVMYAQGRMPAAFALPAGAGDVAIGLLAPIVALAYARGVAGRELLVGGWNLLGLLDLANAITTGFLTSPSPLQVLSLDAPNQLISEFPLVLVPVFGVPLAVILHVASLIKLSRPPIGA